MREKRGKSLSGGIVKAMGIFSGVQAVGIICSVVRAKLISLWIGATGVGIFATFNTALDMLSAATQLNMRESAVRDIASSPKAKVGATATAVRWWSLRLGLFGALVMVILSPLLSIVSFGEFSYWWGFALLSVALICLSVTKGEQAVMQGTSDLRMLARSGVWGALSGTILSLPLYYIFGEGSIVPSIAIFSIASMAATLISRRQKGSECEPAERMAIGKKFLRLGAYLTLPTIAAAGASYIFISYLNHTAAESEAGVYQAGYTLVIRYTGIIFTALSMEYFPRISRIATRSRMGSLVVSHEMMLILYILTPLLVIFVASDALLIRLLYTEEFLGAVPFVTVGALAMVFRAISYCMAYVIIARGDGKTYLFTELISSALGLGLNIYMYAHYSFVGLGLSYVLWYVLYTLIISVPYCLSYGMRIKRAAVAVGLYSILTIAISIYLRQFGWWAPALMLIPASIVSIKGYRSLKH